MTAHERPHSPAKNRSVHSEIEPTQLKHDLPVIESLPPRRQLEENNVTVSKLEEVLEDVISQIAEEGSPYRWKIDVLLSRFQNTAGEEISGKELLERLTECTYRERHPKSRKDLRSINEQAGCSLSDVYDDFLSRKFDVEPLSANLEGCSVAVPVSASFSTDDLKKNSKEELSRVVARVCHDLFHSDVFAMTRSAFCGLTISLTKPRTAEHAPREVSGEEVLRSLSLARFQADGNQFTSEKAVLRAAGYKLEDTLLATRAEILRSRTPSERSRAIPTHELDLKKVLDSGDRSGLEGLLTLVFHAKFPGRERDVSYKDLFPIRITDGPGFEVSAPVVLARYAWALFKDKNPDDDKTIDKVLRMEEFSLVATLETFKRDVLKLIDKKSFPTSFQSFSAEQLDGFIDEEKLRQVIAPLGLNPAMLIESLALLSPDSFVGRDISEFVRRYVGLSIERGEDIERSGAARDVEHNPYILALMAALRAHKRIADLGGSYQSHQRLFIRALWPSFEDDPSKAVESLRRVADEYASIENYELGEPARKLLHTLHERAADYFESALRFELKKIKTAPFPYQRVGARFLATRDSAILADDVGLGKTYQAAAAALAIDARRVLWVTTASSKENVRADLLEHFDLSFDDVQVITDRGVAERTEQIESLNGARFVITNYETLVSLKSRHRRQYDLLTKGLDVLVIDESQRTDNEKSLRSAAVRSISAPKKWMLSATPYQNRIENMWTTLNQLAPHRFPNKRAFQDLYTDNTKGLVLLHEGLADMMLRRTKAETILRFEDPKSATFHDQLKHRAPRVPTLRPIDPAQEGYVFLSQEQETVIAWMVADFADWANHYNENVAVAGTEIDTNSISPLLKFYWIHVAIYQPELAGIASGNPVVEQAKQIAEQRVAQGEKVILWAWNTPIIEHLTGALKHLGAKRFDGTMSTADKSASRMSFQEDPRTKVLVANYQSGGIAQTFTAAHTAVVAQLPLVFPTLLQVEGRHNRVIGVNNVRHAKEFSNVVYVVPRFTEQFLNAQPRGRLKELLQTGTLAEQTFSRLSGSRVIYNFIMEGYGNPDELTHELNRSLFRSMGLSEKGPAIELGDGLREGKRKLLRISGAFLPVWDLASAEGPTEGLILRVIDSYRSYPRAAIALAQVFIEHKKVPVDDLKLALAAVAVENKFLREALIREVPALMARAYEDGKESLAAECGGSLEGFVLRLNRSRVPEQLGILARDLSGLADTAHYRRQREQFSVGILGVRHSEESQALLEENCGLFAGQSREDRVRCVYQCGLLAQLSPRLMGELKQRFSRFEDLSGALHEKLHHALDDFADMERGSAATVLAAEASWRGSMDHLAALVIGWRTLDGKQDGTQLLEEFKGVLKAVLSQEFPQWRYSTVPRTIGRDIAYLSENSRFWESFQRNCRIDKDTISYEHDREYAALEREYMAVVRAAQQMVRQVEGPSSAAMLSELFWLSPKGLEERVVEAKIQRDAVGKTLAGIELSESERDVARVLGLDRADVSSFEMKSTLLGVIRDLEAAIGWWQIHRRILSMKETGGEILSRDDRGKALGALTRKMSYYRTGRSDGVADSFEGLARRIQAVASAERAPVAYSIEESDSPAVISRMGALEDDLVNCFNPNGNPIFTSFVVGAMASKNMKLIVVRNEEGRVVANAMMKLRRDESGHPVLYLERGLASGAHDFREEMLELLQAKAGAMAEQCGLRPRVMGQIFDRVKETDPEVYGTGSFTESEYVEAVFHLRRGKNVRHHAREYSEGTSGARAEGAAPTRSSVFLGIGTANKRIEDYISELKEIGATRVVDVRAVPFSRRFPHFSRDELTAHLKRNGIKYTWLGETLGNPLDANGQRTLEGFDRYRSEASYERGLQQLMALAGTPGEVIAVTCSENKEAECHRKFILQDVRARWSVEAE